MLLISQIIIIILIQYSFNIWCFPPSVCRYHKNEEYVIYFVIRYICIISVQPFTLQIILISHWLDKQDKIYWFTHLQHTKNIMLKIQMCNREGALFLQHV